MSTLYNQDDDEFVFNEKNINRIKELYSREMRDDETNPIKECMRLIYQSAIEKEPGRRSQLSHDLSEFLIQPGGLMKLFLSMVDFDITSQKVTTHNQRFVAIANIISGLPKISVTFEEFCSNIGKQLKSLISNDNPLYSNLGCIIMRSLLDSPRAKDLNISAILIDPITKAVQNPNGFHMKPCQAILAIHNLIQNHIPIKHFVHIFPNLLYALKVLNDTKSGLKFTIKSCLVSILNELKPGVACCLIEEALTSPTRVYEFMKCSNDEGVIIDFCHDAQSKISEELDSPIVTDLLIEILKLSQNDKLIIEFFFHFKELMLSSEDKEYGLRCATLIQPLLVSSIDESSDLNLLASIMNNSTRSLELIIRAISSYLNILNSKKENEDDHRMFNSLGSCLDILEVLVLSPSSDLIPMLELKCLPMIEQLKTEVQNYNNNKRLAQSKESIQEHISDLMGKIQGLNSQGRHLDLTKEEILENEYDSLVKDLNDRLVPVRVHSILRFKQMVIANEPFMKSRIPQIFNMIESALADQEPYVFLASINLMAEMALRDTKSLLPRLIELYSRHDLDIQHRINVGEVLVRLDKQLNATTPYYAEQAMNVFLVGCKDQEELIRVSSLSNIGELCHNLGDSLSKYIVEILSCVENLIKIDTIQVKCAAIHLLRTTLSGLDSRKAESIQRELKDIYDILKMVKRSTLDENLNLQVDLTLDEIDRLARELLGLDVKKSHLRVDSLVKNIKVLSLDKFQ